MTQCPPLEPIQELVEFGLKKTQLRNAYVQGMMELLSEIDPCIHAVNKAVGSEQLQTIDGAGMKCAIHKVLSEVYEMDKQHLLDSEIIVSKGIARTETKHFKRQMEKNNESLKKESKVAETRVPPR